MKIQQTINYLKKIDHNKDIQTTILINIMYLFTGCNVTRQSNACLELICQKWSHSLLELDLSWASANRPLDDAVSALADSPSSKLR